MTTIVTGARNGLGKCILEELLGMGIDAKCYDILDGYDVGKQEDMTRFLERYEIDTVENLINCAGINALCPIPEVTKELWDKVMDTNAYSFLAMTQACLLCMTKDSKIINVISNASHMPMTHSIVYNASKGAGAIMTRQMARELTRTQGITVIGISPNKMKDTLMSKEIDEKVCALRGWTPEQARSYQLNGLVTKTETDPLHIAQLVGFLCSHDVKYMSGCILETGY